MHSLVRRKAAVQQCAENPRPTAYSIITTGVMSHRDYETDPLQLWVIYVCFAIFPEDSSSCKAQGKSSPESPRPRSKQPHSPRDRR